ncbi:amidase family protein [Alteribacter natronophilus]|uniref:amidase family protein n=1 Tax=Alteribacter natronophilus TaxID=2583810 RepID=UPI00110EEB84|nr:amidase family protein [Alteribacter natronophilus]TMW73397.1 amidase [Alteribacter natronophilus]
MDLNTYLRLDATDLAELVRKMEMKPEELINLSRRRFTEVNPALNAVTHHRYEKAAHEAGSSRDGLLAGVPFLLKNISQSLKGEPITSGSFLLKQWKARQDSHFVSRLKSEGLIMCGHTNTPEFGLKNITEPRLYGAARNPADLRYSPGGSSGGAAAAVAAGIVPAAGASDGGGSIRIPASFTGLTGLKPTRGRTPVGPGIGRQWQGAAIDFVLTRTVRDCALFLDILETVQQDAAFQVPRYGGRYTDCVNEEKNGPLRIGFSVNSPVGTPVHPDAEAAVVRTARWLEQMGHQVEEAEPDIDGIELMKQYYLMNCGEMAAAVKSLGQLTGRNPGRNDMEMESWVLAKAGERVSAADYSLSLSAWDRAAADAAEFHSVYDMYLTPATASTAPGIGELTMEKKKQEALIDNVESASFERQQELIYEMFLPSLTYTPFTQLANLTGQPAISLPVSVNKSGLPLGIQLLAAKGREDLLLKTAGLIEKSPLWKPADPHAVNTEQSF